MVNKFIADRLPQLSEFGEKVPPIRRAAPGEEDE
jgi:hypothetical protein